MKWFHFKRVTSARRLFALTGFAICLIASVSSEKAVAFDLGMGLAALEQGNDTFRPAAQVRIGWTDYVMSDFYYSGRSFGLVEEKLYIAALSRRFSVQGSSWFYGSAGGELLVEDTVILGSDDSEESSKAGLSERSIAPGLSLGVGAKLLNIGALRADFLWTTHLYPAGVFGGILLAHGRKQTFGLTAGVDL